MEQKPVTRAEIISDLEDIVEELRSGKYPSVALLQNLIVNERRISNHISESYQSGKQVMIIMRQEAADGN